MMRIEGTMTAVWTAEGDPEAEDGEGRPGAIINFDDEEAFAEFVRGNLFQRVVIMAQGDDE